MSCFEATQLINETHHTEQPGAIVDEKPYILSAHTDHIPAFINDLCTLSCSHGGCLI